MRFKKKTATFGLCLLLAGCGTLPSSGPYSHDIHKNIDTKIGTTFSSGTLTHDKVKYVLVDLDENTIRAVSQRKSLVEKTYKWPNKENVDSIKVGINDTIQLTIYEQNSGGLFVPKEAGVRPGNFVSIPPQTVDETGYITVPYAGEIKAAGKTAAEISAHVTAALSSLALAPQVVVSFTSRGGSEVSVLGAVEDAQRFSIGFNKETVLDAIATAGGPDFPGYETWISLQRDNREYSILMDELLLNPKRDIFVKPNDRLYLFREPEGFSVYGAAQNQGYVTFDKRELFLGEALAKAQGLRDTQADPEALFIFQEENPKLITQLQEQLGLDISDFGAQETIPVIYRLNLREHKGFFLANRFPMRDDDIVFVSNAESVDFVKFLSVVSATASTKTTTTNAF